MPELHWAEWVFFGSVAACGAIFALKLWFIHHTTSDGLGDKPVELGSHTAKEVQRNPREPIEVSAEQRCPCCHGDLKVHEGLHRCAGCQTMLHWECHREFGCPILGCEYNAARKQAIASEKGESGEDEGKARVSLKEKA